MAQVERAMLTKRIIPCLDVDAGRVVKGVSFVDLKDAGDPAELASFYDHEGADELVFLDITASSDDRGIMVEVVKKVSENLFIPLTVGGGLSSIEDIHRMLDAGTDKISLNTAAVLDWSLVAAASNRFGAQCIVVAVDARSVPPNADIANTGGAFTLDPESRWEVYTHGGRKATGLDAVKWCRHMAAVGAGELLLTSMDSDGHKYGYDLELTRSVSEAVTIPVIASGGAGSPDHLLHVLEEGKADAALAASIFHFGTYSIAEVKQYLAEHGVPIRPIEGR